MKERYKYPKELQCASAPPWDILAVKNGHARQSSRVKGKEKEKEEKTSPATMSSSTSSSSKAPKPWQVCWSKSQKREYYFNPITKKSVWKLEDCK